MFRFRRDFSAKVSVTCYTYFCVSPYHCTVKCPRGIDVAGMMYGLKRYSLWRNRFKRGLIGPDFSRRFARRIAKTGRSFEPGLAPAFLFKSGVRGLLQEAWTAVALLRKGRLSLTPSRIRRLKNFRRMLGRIIPVGGLS